MKALILLLLTVVVLSPAYGQDLSLPKFIDRYCSDCHADGVDKGGLDFDKLKYNLQDPASFAIWERIYDRVLSGEMPPKKKKKQPSAEDLKSFDSVLAKNLLKAHHYSKGTVLRRLNSREYENTLNDMFGTKLELAKLLPEDGRSHEFDNVGESLGMSMVQLQRYMELGTKVLDATIESRPKPLPIKEKVLTYDHPKNSKHIGKKFKKLDDGTIVRFHGSRWPDGIMHGSGVSQEGYYEIELTGYAYQSKEPIPFSIIAKGYGSSSNVKRYGFSSLPPKKYTTLKFTLYLNKGRMIAFEPYGKIHEKKLFMKSGEKFNLNTYKGPGFAVKHVKMRGPIRQEFPSKGHSLLFDGIDRQAVTPSRARFIKDPSYRYAFKINSTNPANDAAVSLKRLAQKAFRQKDPDISQYLGLFKSEMTKGKTFEKALRTASLAILCSPDFIFFKESPGKLDDYAIASRMSYFLTRTMPDDKLFEMARSGKLQDPKIRKQELYRLMKKPEFDRFIKDFTDAWLNLRDMDFTEPDKKIFPEYGGYLRHSMPLETREFFKELIMSNLSVSNIIKSDFAMLNGRLAELYGIDDIKGPDIRKVKLPADSVRGGILSQAGIHKVSANGTNTSPVVRGIWVLERILGVTPPPPPPGIPGVEPDIRGAQTLREILDKHRDSTNCNACHVKIDPLGFAMEVFSPIGVYRENFRAKKGKGKRLYASYHGSRTYFFDGPKVDASGEFYDGRSFANFSQFRDHLVKDQELVAKTMIKKLLTFATGRDMGFSDREEIESITKVTAKNDYRLRDIFEEVMNSKIFLMK